MSKTIQSFADKWSRNPRLLFAETQTEGSEIQQWILRRNGFQNLPALRSFLAPKKRILDAGCGNGRITALLRACSDPGTTEIVAIDLAAVEVARSNLRDLPNVTVSEADICSDLRRFGAFDFIYCQEVLHHLSNPQQGFNRLCSVLDTQGHIAIYVYKKKAPVREFVDDYIRERLSQLPYESAYAACEQITRLGQSLFETDVTVSAPAVDILGIPAGEYSLQRLFYHFVCKCFWNPALSFNDNVVINYDWYHPEMAHRYTAEEVRQWFSDAHLRVVHETVDEYGITMWGKRDAAPESSQSSQ